MTTPSTMAVALGLCAIGRRVLLAVPESTHVGVGVMNELPGGRHDGLLWHAATRRVTSAAGGVVEFVDERTDIERLRGQQFHHFIAQAWLSDEKVAQLRPLVRLEVGV